MTTVYKYELSRHGETTVQMPHGAQVLMIDAQVDLCGNRNIFVWALVDTDNQPEPRFFEVFGTGHQMPTAQRRFVNTFFVSGGNYVFHAFERIAG